VNVFANKVKADEHPAAHRGPFKEAGEWEERKPWWRRFKEGDAGAEALAGQSEERGAEEGVERGACKARRLLEVCATHAEERLPQAA
jgi:hypothetical protein